MIGLIGVQLQSLIQGCDTKSAVQYFNVSLVDKIVIFS